MRVVSFFKKYHFQTGLVSQFSLSNHLHVFAGSQQLPACCSNVDYSDQGGLLGFRVYQEPRASKS